MRIRNRVLAITASGGVVAGACTGEANTSIGDGVAVDFGDYNVIRMYAVYLRNEEGSSVHLHPCGVDWSEGDLSKVPGMRSMESNQERRLQVPDLADESINRYLEIRVDSADRTVPSSELRELLDSRPDRERNPIRDDGTRMVQIGQFTLRRDTSEGLDSTDFAQLFEIEFGWQVPDSDGTDDGNQPVQVRRMEFVPVPGTLVLLGLAGFVARRRRG